MLTCKECGELIQPQDIYCPYCGLRLKEASYVEQLPAPESNIPSSIPSQPEPRESKDFITPPKKQPDLKDNIDFVPKPESKPMISPEFSPMKDIPVSEQKKFPDEKLLKEKAGIDLGPTEEMSIDEITPENISIEKMSFEETIPDSHVELRPSRAIIEAESATPPPSVGDAPNFSSQISPPKSISPKEPIAPSNLESHTPRIKEKNLLEERNPAPEASSIKESIINPPLEEVEPLKPVIPPSALEIEKNLAFQEPAISDPAPAKILKPSEPSPTPLKSELEKDVIAEKPIIKSKLRLLPEGTVLNGRYEIVRKIGGGGMGAVYLAKDRNLGGAFRAVKEMIQSYIEEEKQEKAISDFKREAFILSSLEHPSIPTIYDYFHDEKEGRFYLVMKYISGGDLAARLRSSPEGRIEEKIVTQWAIQIADVLDYLHNHQPPIIYRDLKPSNIMIDSNTERVMLVDFGIARWVRKEEKGVTAVGTMGYAPPELFGGIAEPRSDIYSLGATMFHLLTGADPQSNPLLIFDFTKNPRPRQINPTLSDQIEQIIMKAVEYRVERRFSSAREMKEALIEHLQNLETGKVTFGKKQAAAEVSTKGYVYCVFCGQRILETDLFCPFCGTKQEQPKKSITIEPPLPKITKAKLYVIGTDELSVPVFEIEKEAVLIGRRDPLSNIYPDIDLTKFDPQTKISRRHARIWLEGEKYMIEDLGSSNGTTILRLTNEIVRLLPRQPKQLFNGDKIKLGDTTLRFVIG